MAGDRHRKLAGLIAGAALVLTALAPAAPAWAQVESAAAASPAAAEPLVESTDAAGSGAVGAVAAVQSTDAAPARALRAESTAAEAGGAPAGSPEAAWLADPSAARKQAIATGMPLLVYATMKGCPACAYQEAAFEDGAVAKALAGWVCLRMDVNEHEEDALLLRVTGTPALRALTALGGVKGAVDGFLPAADLEPWLARQRAECLKDAESSVKALSAAGALTEGALDALVGLLGDKQAEVREAAIERLGRDPEHAAPAVVKSLRQGNLAVRLSALEILKVWEAPVADADPWRPETIDPVCAKLVDWLQRNQYALALPTRAELDRDFQTLAEGDDARASAALARLSRVGPDLLPETRQRIADERRDKARARLVMLRYRLAMPSDVARERPDMVDALVSAAPADRARAVEALARKGGDLQPLFLELFQDPDPLVRETALRALRRSAGSSATKTLAELLTDPQPNVRAEVLKELAQSPSAEMLPILQEYVRTENDEDLVVHAVRALSVIKVSGARKALASLAGHGSWQVRAEVAEAIGNAANYDPSGRRNLPVSAVEALKTLLADQDTFVVAKAIDAVETTRTPAGEELAAAAQRVPDLAVRALKAMASNEEGRQAAVPYLRKFVGNSDPAIRAAALSALAECTQANIGNELDAAFKDADSQVRKAAADVVKLMLQNEEKVPAAVTATWRAPLEKMLSAEDGDERCSAAIALVAMKITDKAFDALKQLAGNNADMRERVAGSLGDLGWQKRKDLFDYLLSLELSEDAYNAMIGGLTEGSPPEAVPVLWAVVDKDPRAAQALSALDYAFLAAYLGDGRYDLTRRSPAASKMMAEESAKRLDVPDERIRMLALGLLFAGNPSTAADRAEGYFTAAGTSAAMRRNAFAILALTRPRDQVDRAVAACADQDEGMQTLALAFLAEGKGCEPCRHLEVEKEIMYLDFSYENSWTGSDAAAKPAKPPGSLTPAVLTPLLSSSRPYARAAAGYLLAMQGDSSGVRTLADAWREGRGYTERDYLVEAVVALNDDALTPFLEEVYSAMDTDEDRYEIKDFYWKIRPLGGPRILALRKRIRDEVGMANLR